MQKANDRTAGLVYLICAALMMGLSGSVGVAAERSKAAAAPVSHGTQPAAIDWQNVEHASPIPHQMPVADADTAIQSGFAPQWIERSITQWPPSFQDPNLPAKLILRIAKGNRRPDDRWAHEAADKLRATIRMTGDADVIRYGRVFCGSEGCLCYFELPNDATSLEPYYSARSALLHGLLDNDGWGHALGIKTADVDEVGETGVWELIYVLRNKPKS
jgi:hypothetical protein